MPITNGSPGKRLAVTERIQGRALATAVALAVSVALAGCNGDDLSLASNAKANKPIPEKLVAEMQAKDMDPQSPMLVRLFKQEAELEVWKQNRSGKFALLKTYPICRWSGDLGPKVREGDRQAPEGFYSITPAQMNPQSAYYLSFNMGYPNAFDKALGRTGSQLMVHGDCSSRGCYAMTDEQISDIYALGRESFFGGQRAFQVQAYPFKMTPVNLAKHRNNPNMPFWKMIKEGYDHFEVTRQEPKVDFCENKYVFDAAAPAGATRPLTFNAAAKCPAYVIPDDIADAVREKQQQDNARVAELVAKGAATARLNTGIDGGMNRVFAAKLPDGNTGLSEGGEGQALSMALYTRAPGTIPSHVNPPKGPALASANAGGPVGGDEPMIAVTRASDGSPRLASASASDSSSNFLSALARKVGIGGSDTTATTAPAAASTAAARPRPRPPEPVKRPPSVVAAKPAPKPADSRLAVARPPLKPSLTAPEPTAPAAGASAALAGSQPVMSTNSFDSRFSAMR